jgi:hypothetical protein
MEYAVTDEGDENSESKKARLREVFEEAMKRHSDSEAFEEDERELVYEDHLFCDKPGSQWDELGIRGRKRAKRPMYEINQVALARNQFVGDQLQNRIDIKIRPKKGGVDQDIAETFEGVVRNITDASGDEWKANALKEAATGGIGACQICTRYTQEDGWDQEIYLKPIRSAFSTLWVDPNSIMDDHSDAMWMSVTTKMTPTEFEKRWPNSKAANFRMIGINGCRSGWRTQEFIRVADYYSKEEYKRKLVLMTDGKTYEDDEKFQKVEDELYEKGIFVSRRKTVVGYKVMHYKLSGAEVLEGPNEVPFGDMIPIGVNYGYSNWIDGVHYYCGIIRKAKDPQRVYNYETSNNVETGGLAPKDPYWITTTQGKGYEGELKRMAVTNDPIAFYNADPQSPGPPKRTGAPAVNSAQLARIQQAAQDIQSSTGYFAPSLGDNPQHQSGIALRTQQRAGATGTYEIASNHSKMIEYVGKVLVKGIPILYDGTRQERILREDGETELVTLNEVVIDEETGEEITLNDVSAGTFDVKVDVGPSFATKREEAVAYLTEAGRSNPMIHQLMADIVMKNMDFPGAKEGHKRFRKVGIRQGFVEPNEKESEEIQQNQKPDPMQIIQFEMARAEVEKRVAEVDKMDLENDKIRAETAAKWAEVEETIKTADIRTVQGLATAEKAIEEVNRTIQEGRMADAHQLQQEQMNAQQMQQQAQGQQPPQVQ